MRIHGWCTSCHRVKVVRVTSSGNAVSSPVAAMLAMALADTLASAA